MNFAVFVSSTDTYSDCWLPFFKLFKKFWPSYNGIIYLNTEFKSFSYPGLNIICTQVRRFKPKGEIVFSERLLLAFKHVVKEENLLYTHDDFFLEDYVNHDVINKLFDASIKYDYSYLNLTTFANHGPFSQSPNVELIWEIDKKDEFRNSYQASFWKLSDMIKIIRKHEDPWRAEYYGSIGSRRMNFKYACLNRDFFTSKNQVFPYANTTGIYRSKWIKETVYPLFKNNDIDIDFSIRGFYDKEENGAQKKTNPFTLKKVINTIRSLI